MYASFRYIVLFAYPIYDIKSPDLPGTNWDEYLSTYLLKLFVGCLSIYLGSHLYIPGSALSVLDVLPISIRGPPVAPSHSDPQRRGPRRVADPCRLHVQRRGQRPVLSTTSSPQNSWEPSGKQRFLIYSEPPFFTLKKNY